VINCLVHLFQRLFTRSRVIDTVAIPMPKRSLFSLNRAAYNPFEDEKRKLMGETESYFD
jgi:hypothetical protein